MYIYIYIHTHVYKAKERTSSTSLNTLHWSGFGSTSREAAECRGWLSRRLHGCACVLCIDVVFVIMSLGHVQGSFDICIQPSSSVAFSSG